MALLRPLGLRTCRPEHRQIPLQGREGKDNITIQSSTSPTLPSGFPQFLDSELAWSTSEIQVKMKHIYHVTHKDRAEIDKELAYFKAQGLDGDLVDSTNFPLPNLRHTLRKLSLELYSGRGFCLIRDLEYEKYSVEDNMVIFLGIQSFIAETRARQDEKGNMIGSYESSILCNEPDCYDSAYFYGRYCFIRSFEGIPYETFEIFHCERLGRNQHGDADVWLKPFHTYDLGDILAFQTRSAAARCGECILSSAYTIYNELAATRPDVIRTLSEPNWPLHIPYHHQRALLFYEDSRIIFNFAPSALLGSKAHPRPTNIPSISSQQLEALTIVQALAEKHKISIRTQKGDLHFFNNLALVHRRDAAEVGPGGRRHLVRIYLRNEVMAWKIPDILNSTSGWEESYRQGEDVEQV